MVAEIEAGPPGRDDEIEDSSAPLIEHLAELRRRIIKMALAFVVGAAVAWAFREQLLLWIKTAREEGGRRSDDMFIIRGVNVFPSQIEAALLAVEGVQPHYQIILTRGARGLDEVEVQVEVFLFQGPKIIFHASTRGNIDVIRLARQRAKKKRRVVFKYN